MRLPPHQLPEQSQGVHWTSFIQIFSSYADEREAGDIPAQVHGVITVLQLECVGKNIILNGHFLCLCYLHFFTCVHREDTLSSCCLPALGREGC